MSSSLLTWKAAYFVPWLHVICGAGSSVGIATSYGLDGPGIKSRWRRDFRTCPDRPWGPPSHLYNGYRVFAGGKEWPGRDVDPSPTSSAVGHERVELYFYSLYGPYGLYRASVELYLYSPYGPYGLYRASVELYLYSPYRPYGLYRASVPVQGCTLPFFLPYTIL
jgi:hypothetical protein